jgi:hypothetical protein
MFLPFFLFFCYVLAFMSLDINPMLLTALIRNVTPNEFILRNGKLPTKCETLILVYNTDFPGWIHGISQIF